jgi:hypothetical protein
MNRKQDCWPNAPMESFQSALESKPAKQRDYLPHDEVAADAFRFLQRCRNRRRLQSAPSFLTLKQKVASFQATTSAVHHCPFHLGQMHLAEVRARARGKAELGM